MINVSTGKNRTDIPDLVNDTSCNCSAYNCAVVVRPVNILFTGSHFRNSACKVVNESSFLDLLLGKLFSFCVRLRSVNFGDIFSSFLSFDRSIELLDLILQCSKLSIFLICKGSVLGLYSRQESIQLFLFLVSLFDKLFHRFFILSS